jgi:cobalt-zinc-cadmium efflux system membrane fusion protein
MKHSKPFAAALAAVCLLAAGCSGPKPVAAAGAGPGAAGTGLLTLSPGQLAHLKIAPVISTNWSIVVRTTGTVDWNSDRTTPAITQVSGPVVRLVADTGDAVKAGQPLLYVSSPDVANAISAYRKARNRQDLTRRVLARSADLLKHGAIAPKDYESAQADFNDAATDVQSSLQALKIFGITQAEIEAAEAEGASINPELAVRAPISGVVVQKLVASGQLIQAGATTCFVISDVSTVWVQGHVFDRDLPSVRVGDTVDESNASLPTAFHGVVEYVGAMLDPATRTTPVRIVTRNPGGLLKKDMFVDAVIHTRTRRNLLVVPASAVVHNAQNEPFVYLQDQPGRFSQRLVTAGGQQDGQIEIVSGLKEGDSVVSEGSLFLQFANDSE